MLKGKNSNSLMVDMWLRNILPDKIEMLRGCIQALDLRGHPIIQNLNKKSPNRALYRKISIQFRVISDYGISSPFGVEVKEVLCMNKKTMIGLIAIVAIVMFTGCVEEETPVSTPSTVTPTPSPTLMVTPVPHQEEPTFTGLSISQLVEGLAYSEDTGNALTQMVDNWLDEQGKPVYSVWENEFTNAREAFDQGKISEQELVETEIRIIEEVSQKIKSEVSYKEVSHTYRTFDLAEIIKQGQANCLGYSQLF